MQFLRLFRMNTGGYSECDHASPIRLSKQRRSLTVTKIRHEKSARKVEKYTNRWGNVPKSAEGSNFVALCMSVEFSEKCGDL